MSIIGWLVIGAVAGWLASIVMKRDGSMGWIENIIVGILGALVGGFLYGIITDSNYTNDFSLGTLIVAFLGACLLLFLYGAIRGRR